MIPGTARRKTSKRATCFAVCRSRSAAQYAEKINAARLGMPRAAEASGRDDAATACASTSSPPLAQSPPDYFRSGRAVRAPALARPRRPQRRDSGSLRFGICFAAARPGLMSGCSIGPTRFLYLVENASNLTLPDFHPLPLPVASRDSTSILDFCTSGHTSSGCQSVFPIAHGHSDGLCRKEAVASRENDQSEQKFRTAVAWHRRALGHRTRDAHVGPIYPTVRQFAAAPDGP